jgi:excisionase family DNA binding protein
MAVEVRVTNPVYCSHRAPELAQLLRQAGEAGEPSSVPDPKDLAPDPERTLTIADPAYWAENPGELAEMLSLAGQAAAGTTNAVPADRSAGGPERLTMTVEEAAAALGISRAFAYEAVARNEIPHVRIGRRILVPRAALQRMLEPGAPGSSCPSGNPRTEAPGSLQMAQGPMSERGPPDCHTIRRRVPDDLNHLSAGH